jgi:hypothetical protein
VRWQPLRWECDLGFLGEDERVSSAFGGVPAAWGGDRGGVRRRASAWLQYRLRDSGALWQVSHPAPRPLVVHLVGSRIKLWPGSTHYCSC